MIRYTWLAAAAVLALACEPAAAQKMYRCGRTYQDRPCDSGQKGRVIGNTGTGAVPSARSGSSEPECQEQAAAAQRIMWRREGGMTQEDQLFEIDSQPVSGRAKAAQRKLLGKVYAKSGTSVQVKSAIEADCLAEKEREAQAAALLKATGQRPAGYVPQSTPQEADADNGTRKLKEAAREAQIKTERCAQLNRSLESIRAQQRSGASAASMDGLNAQRRRLDAELREQGC